MVQLHVMNFEGQRRVEVILSRRNLLSLLHKLDMPGSMRQLESNDCYEDGAKTPFHSSENSALPRTTLVLRCEEDREHYAKRSVGPGQMHPATERFVAEESGAGTWPHRAPEPLPWTHLTLDDAREQVARWHLNQARLSEREREILSVAEAVLRELERRSP